MKKTRMKGKCNFCEKKTSRLQDYYGMKYICRQCSKELKELENVKDKSYCINRR